MEFKLFGKWVFNIEVNDLGLKSYINLEQRTLPKTDGRTKNKHIIEKLITHLMIPGHRGKKQQLLL